MKKVVAILLLTVLLLGLMACGAKPEETVSSEKITVTDLIGREVEVQCGSYQRIVCIGAGALRMYSYVGDTELLCGVEDVDNTALAQRPQMFDSVARPYVMAYGDAFQSLPSCGVGGPNAQTAEAEKILACNPDLVISEYKDVEKENALQQQLGVPVITLRSGPMGVFDDCFAESLSLLGTILGREERAAELNAFVQQQRQEISDRTADIPEEEKPAAYICGLGNWGTANHRMTTAKYAPFMVANVRNVVTELPAEGAAELEEEAFLTFAPQMDILFLDTAAIKNIAPLYAEDSAMFDACKAWKNGEVYLQMAFNAYYTNYELMLTNTWFIAKTVYPERFDDVDLTEKTDEITRTFLQKAMAEEIFAYPSSFGGYQRIDTENFFLR